MRLTGGGVKLCTLMKGRPPRRRALIPQMCPQLTRLVKGLNLWPNSL